jgi:Ca2+-transporting ATPase
LVLLIIGITITISALLIYVAPFAKFFQFEPVTLVQLGISIGLGFIFVVWFELVKWRNRMQTL